MLLALTVAFLQLDFPIDIMSVALDTLEAPYWTLEEEAALYIALHQNTLKQRNMHGEQRLHTFERPYTMPFSPDSALRDILSNFPFGPTLFASPCPKTQFKQELV